jgi:hypothetical protein
MQLQVLAEFHHPNFQSAATIFSFQMFWENVTSRIRFPSTSPWYMGMFQDGPSLPW